MTTIKEYDDETVIIIDHPWRDKGWIAGWCGLGILFLWVLLTAIFFG